MKKELRYPFYRDEFSVEKYQHGEGFVIRIRKFLLFDQGVEVECLLEDVDNPLVFSSED